MQKLMHTLIVLSLLIFFAHAVYVLIGEASAGYKTLKTLYGLSDTQKQHYLIGDLYTFADSCNRIIPENSSILFLSNVFNNKSSFDLLLNYYLYPRKLYWLNNTDPYPAAPPEPGGLDPAWLRGRNIEWIILRYPDDYGVNTVVQLERGIAVQSFTLDPAGGHYSAP
jgi:hypothetical protein